MLNFHAYFVVNKSFTLRQSKAIYWTELISFGRSWRRNGRTKEISNESWRNIIYTQNVAPFGAKNLVLVNLPTVKRLLYFFWTYASEGKMSRKHVFGVTNEKIQGGQKVPHCYVFHICIFILTKLLPKMNFDFIILLVFLAALNIAYYWIFLKQNDCIMIILAEFLFYHGNSFHRIFL